MKAIVFVARGLQLGALGCYGNPWIDTHALDALAAEGIVFDQHFADNADPTGARRAWRSGRYHLPGDASAARTQPPDLLDALKKQGTRTCLIVDDSRSSWAELADGWERVERVSASEDETPLDAVLEAVGTTLEQLERRDNWLLWIDLATLLPPWNLPAEFQEAYFTEESDEEDEEEEYDETDEAEEEESEPLTPLTEAPAGAIDGEDDYLYLSLQTSYAAAVSYVDAGFGQLLEALAGLEGGDDILLIVTTDAGQNLGEHGLVGTSRSWLHEEMIHLPLLLRLPGAAEAGRRVTALTQAVDLAPTLASWFQTPLPDAHGHSLLPLARGEVESVRPYACAGLQVGEAIEYALRTPEWAFLLPVKPGAADEGRSPQLYVKPDDRWEVNNVVQHHLELAEQLERTLRGFVTATCQPGPLHFPPLPETETVAQATTSEASPSDSAAE
ncbi:MAG TPA: sulfatase-like hydrolase/transferase [Gemmataceae bacterium]|nr:sulfatase-like hydrolase/transferase [Gemmataceae bacterium]